MGNGGRAILKTHQIVFRLRGNKTTVSCQCRAHDLKHCRTKGGGEYYEPFEVQPDETVWNAYNNPENHWVEFTEQDRIKA